MRGEQQREVKSQIREVLKWTKEGTGASKTSNKMDNPGICGTGKMYEKKMTSTSGSWGVDGNFPLKQLFLQACSVRMNDGIGYNME